ncbi:hypothetical protein HQ325_16650 [Rhodococcus sp. BP-349]|uniref:hypothetical protein n=1 Tax=unclassified Rhodococcus (in: high G+C Gram-positive bacteria) TaxID=192944 RepID=UPI001C9BACE4|nr:MULTISPECIES: hypothetical protein [unclassified Rhodococcus (in: high G+C Gram-positive bacteria)]MBY6540305.1 hypothetical protein [Rhodococcus sp. BP-363]MBY6545670.1 hypothetical protein [Rhodococcus sp. BP-369]MBY6564900.1 hypothetical protein [Rhodococcus sp. BP-370]MBY6578164.1 hypothetical protein [Rhodococcus sp. BP-364]MBY6587465.1 hypothetical protein [Rhodococcus sp. BP-358]
MRAKIAAAACTSAALCGLTLGGYALVDDRADTQIPLLSADDATAKLDAASAVGSVDASQASSISGEGPVPQVVQVPDGSVGNPVVTNTVIAVEEGEPNRALVTRTMRYSFPNGSVVETEPGTVPFVFEPDGEWRVDREYLCRTVRMMENIARQDGFAIGTDPGCS